MWRRWLPVTLLPMMAEAESHVGMPARALATGGSVGDGDGDGGALLDSTIETC